MDIRTLSRYTGAICLVLGPLSVTVAPAVYNEDDPVAQQLADVAGHPGAMTLSLALGLVNLLLLPAMLYAARLARRGAPRLAAIGGTLSFLAWLAGLLSLNAMGIVYAVAAKSPDRDAAVGILTAATSHWSYNVLVLLFVLGHVVGMLLLGLALWRSRAVPAWAGLIFAFAMLAHVVARQFGPTADQATYGLLTVSTVVAAIALIRTPNDEWDLPSKPARIKTAPAPVAVAAG